MRRTGLLAWALACALAAAAPAVPAYAIDPGEALKNPVQEARARALFKQLRCLVCQNESIDDSEADLARDLRKIVREKIVAGDSDQQILKFLTARYGDFVLLKPPVEPRTWVLWFGPFALLAMGAAGLYVMRRRRGGMSAARPLSAEEQTRLAQLLDGNNDEGTGAP